MKSTLVSVLIVSGAYAMPAFGEDLAPSLHTAFVEGRFAEAASGAVTLQSADAKAFAARARLAEVVCFDGPPSADLLDDAERLATAALNITPAHVEGRLQLAIASSLQARSMPTRRAMRNGRRARQLVESVLVDDPANAYAHGFLAVWHVEVYVRGGRLGAAIMDASLDEAQRHYSGATAIQPGDVAIHWQYARALASFDPERFAVQIEAALAAALAGDVDSNVDAVMARRARILSDWLETGDWKTVKETAAGML